MGLGSAEGNICSELKEKVSHNYYFSIKNIFNEACLLFLLEHRDIFIGFDTSVASTKINGVFYGVMFKMWGESLRQRMT